MISVIDRETNAVSNPYPGMNLAEACNAMEIFTLEACNEFQMDVLLSEHAYLYANGNEVSYVDEAGNLNEKGAALKEKAIATIKAVGAKVVELWDKLIEWVSQRLDEVKTAFAKASLNKKNLDIVSANFDTVFHRGAIYARPVRNTVSDAFKNGEWKKYIHNEDQTVTEINPKAIFSTYIKSHELGALVDKKVFDQAVDIVFNNTILKDIKACKKDANDSIARKISRVKAAKGDDMDQEIADLKSTMVANNAVSKEAIKTYHLLISSNIGMLKYVMSIDEVKDLYMSKTERKIRDTASSAGKSVKNAAGKAGEGMKNAAGAAKAKFFNRPGKEEE